jgi:hypothetical protein
VINWRCVGPYILSTHAEEDTKRCFCVPGEREVRTKGEFHMHCEFMAYGEHVNVVHKLLL